MKNSEMIYRRNGKKIYIKQPEISEFSFVSKLWGDYDKKFQQLRNLYTYMWAHPGKKLNFMGNELGSFDEWNEHKSLTWELKKFPIHDSLGRMIRDLNLIYQS